jgi:hypothetical protein
VTPTPPVIPGPPEHDETFSLAQLSAPAGRRKTSPLVFVVAGLGALVVLMGIAVVALLASRPDSSTRTAAVATPGPTAVTGGSVPDMTSKQQDTPTARPVTSAPVTEEGTTEVPFGQTLVLSTSLGDEAEYTVSADKTYARTKYGTRPEKGALYGIKVEVRVRAGSVYACFCDFALIAADGTAYEGQTSVAGAMEGVELRAGQRAGGVVVFDVPQNAWVGGRIELREGDGHGDRGFWTIP